jgi:hypothetical protein
MLLDNEQQKFYALSLPKFNAPKYNTNKIFATIIFLKTRILPFPRTCVTFHNMLDFYTVVVVSPPYNPKLKDRPVSAVHDCLFKIFSVTLHI